MESTDAGKESRSSKRPSLPQRHVTEFIRRKSSDTFTAVSSQEGRVKRRDKATALWLRRSGEAAACFMLPTSRASHCFSHFVVWYPLT